MPAPTADERTVDAINGIGDFKTRCRWAEFWRNDHKDRVETEQAVWASYYHNNPTLLSDAQWDRSLMDPEWQWPDPYSKKNYEEELEEEEENLFTSGFMSGVKPEHKKKSAPIGSNELECFLKQVEEAIIAESLANKKNRNETKLSLEFKDLLTQLKEHDMVVIPTDKTNSFTIMSTRQYAKEIKIHLSKSAVKIPKSKLSEIVDNCYAFLTELDPYLSTNERTCLKEKIESKAVPNPKILVKNHKKQNADGTFPTRLVVPATNFTAGFPKIGYLGIKHLLDKYEVDYGSKNIIQSSDLKQKLESLPFNMSNSTIVSVDAEAMYPSIKFQLIYDAVQYYAETLPPETHKTINLCLDLIFFGMTNTIIAFKDEYFLYDGNLKPEERCLTIGGYESAWLADLVVSFLLEATYDTMFDPMHYFGIYRDDGLAVFKGKQSTNEIQEWIEAFQQDINDIAGNDFLKFTATIWDPLNEHNPDSITNKSVSIEKTQAFPFLDMEMFWHDNGKLAYRVHLKPNQQLKYLNRGSAHTPGCFKAIPNGVMKRLTKLTSVDESNYDSKLEELYPVHFAALEHSKLVKPNTTPTLGELTKKMEEEKLDTVSQALKKRRERDRKRAIYFKIGYSDFWKKPIHKTLKEIKSRFPSLSWLRISMSYHRFTNIREHFQGDLNSKLNDGLRSLDFEDLDCNCRNREACPYGGFCRRSIVVYKATCLKTGKQYIGNTQQHVKKRIQQHVQDVKQLVLKNKSSDSFASHFACFIPRETEKKEIKNHVRLKVDILWQGKPLSTVKTFGTKSCKLCARERLEILKFTSKHPNLAINKCNEIYGACRHKPRFHRFPPNNNAPSTDESTNDERVLVCRPVSTSSSQSNTSFFSWTSSQSPTARLSTSNDDFDQGLDGRSSSILDIVPPMTYQERRIEGLRARFGFSTPKDTPPVVVHSENDLEELTPTDPLTTDEFDTSDQVRVEGV